MSAVNSLSFDELKTKQRSLREGFPDPLGLRVHRAISWYGRAERETDDPAAAFLFSWIAFNAAYADERGSVRAALIRMLAVAHDLRVAEGELAALDTQRHDLLELLIRLFTMRMLAAVRQGLSRRYLEHADDLPVMRGGLNVKRQLTHHAVRPDRLRLQDRRHYALRTDRGGLFALRPDAVIESADGPIILDTKWKHLEPSAGETLDVAQSDIYQMLAYAHAYDAPRLVLLYPWHARLGDRRTLARWRVEGTTRLLDVACVNVGNPSRVLAELNQIVGATPPPGWDGDQMRWQVQSEANP